MAERSPNFPAVSLGDAIDYARLIYEREGRAKMPRLNAVKPLGYSSLNGRSLGALGALRAYNLIDGRGDDVCLSSDAIAILKAPDGSAEKLEALRRAFEAPSAFAILRSKGDASPDTLHWHLVKANFRDGAADKLLKVYLASRELVNAEGVDYTSDAEHQEPDAQSGAIMPHSASHGHISASVGSAVGTSSATAHSESIVMGVQERVLQSGMLSKQASFRVLVSGPVGAAEIEKLLKKLEMDKDILADSDDNIKGIIVDHDL
jgi:hypothetical protein